MASISFPSSSSSSRSCFCVVNPSPRSTNTPHLSNPPTNSTGQLWADHLVRRRKVSVAVSPLHLHPNALARSRVSPHLPKIRKIKLDHVNFRPSSVNCFSERSAESETQVGSTSSADVDCVVNGLDVEGLIMSSSSSEADELLKSSTMEIKEDSSSLMVELWEWALLISPFFFWGTAMVAMKEVLPKTGPFFISAFRLIPAGLLLVAFASSRGRPFPSGLTAWLSISLFALVDATCFQGFLAEGLERTSAGLGSVIIDSQPLTVAVLAALLFGESIGLVGAAGLVLGVIGLLLLEVPALAFDESNFSLWGSGEWWMLLAAQSMAVGTVMVRWVSKYSDPVMATGWHMVIGGLPLVAVSILNHDPVLSGSFKELTTNDLLALLYTSIFGSAISYGVYFYNATRGSLTKLSSFTFLTPMFASIFGFLYLGETFSPVQLVGAFVTVGAIYMVNYKNSE